MQIMMAGRQVQLHTWKSSSHFSIFFTAAFLKKYLPSLVPSWMAMAGRSLSSSPKYFGTCSKPHQR